MLNQIPSDVIPLKELMVVMANGKQEEEHLYECWLTWGCGLTLQEFTDVAHEEMTTSGWAQNHGDTVWALVRRSDPQGSILSACETHRTRGFLKQKGGNKVENAWYYGMTCVVTPAQHQRKGYATHLLRLMHYILASPLHLPTFPSEWGSPPSPIPIELKEYFPPAWGTFLSSEIGPDFYYRCLVGIDRRGWEAKEVWQEEVEWEILSSSRLSIPSDPSKSSPILARSESIYHAALPNPSEQRVQATSSTNKAVFCPDPASKGILTFASVRGAYGPQPAWRKFPQPLGIRLPAHKGTSGEVHQDDTIILFALYNQQVGDGLLITYIHNLSPDVLPSALSALDRLISEQGAEWNMGRVWDLDSSNDLAAAWKQSGRRVNVNRRRGTGSHLLSWCFYQGKTEVLDRQLWTWL
ncbi:hypothetical protein TREMEDRAFT_31623 [Tremella mesenterica DSM 1558]|uniref:uncharacterized protein n=1 Tax=Tremella mesenterica (strain ATCC 24925 / CBS 8224 / DSM 1558 / NBRC 9311 / NRRL Y-6157 / RJB 2259-6 / UBC 559-6) TaxID=578456 RepID=UPI0003F49CFE|nr:uncharacterized protein TREMEDRAFT_31623 [Tremella mesenterica DSM 1558]EIW68609.1 hypothetical protein TREMEDRAFT_31623 [Tremella mesenterica DSM 1558]